ncbi:hypothetical protein O6H91_Y320000 [Diphasiastrum complanatum]|nr:hypothetical protein O6H91_Y320000 [Diphasiastrum complanatum]
MSFFTGLVLGIVLGLALMVSFKLLERRRSSKKYQLAIATAALSRLTLNELKKMFSKETFPRWIVFSENHKVAWLNYHLGKVWPYLDEATSAVIKHVVEDMLEPYRPAIFSSLKFQRFTLGAVAPQFVVQMIDTTDEEIVMEVELQWDGNPKIVLAIRTAMGVTLPIKVKDIGFCGIFRLVFKPLVKELPCFGAIMCSLRVQKKFDFKLKAVGGEIVSIPGLAGILDVSLTLSLWCTFLLMSTQRLFESLIGDLSSSEV